MRTVAGLYFDILLKGKIDIKLHSINLEIVATLECWDSQTMGTKVNLIKSLWKMPEKLKV